METTIDASKLDQLEKTLRDMKERNPHDPRYAEVERGLNELKLEVPSPAGDDAVSEVDSLLRLIVTSSNGSGMTALHMVQDPKWVPILINLGADKEALHKGLTPFLYCVKNGRVSWNVIQALVDAKVNIHAVDESGQNAFHLVGNSQWVSKLAKLGIDVNATDKKGQSPVHVRSQSFAMFKALVSAGAIYKAPTESEDESEDEDEDDFRNDEIKNAFNTGNVAVLANYDEDSLIRRLVREGKANANSVDSDGQNIIFRLAGKDEIEEWVQRGADINHRDNDDTTPLELAMDDCRDEVVVNLVACGAKIDDPKKVANYVTENVTWGSIFEMIDGLHQQRKRPRTS